MDEKFRVYTVVIPDHDDAFEDLVVSGPVVSWSEITTEGTTMEIADSAMEFIRNWWQSL